MGVRSSWTQDYRDLRVWQKAMDLTVLCYHLTRAFPPEERFGLTSQLRRAAASVAANIAEGNGRSARGEYIHHLSIARGSLSELGTHLELACRLGYLMAEDVTSALELCDHVGRMLTRLLARLRP